MMSFFLDLSQLWAFMMIFFIGLLIGFCYFGGLWLTLCQLPKVNHPYRLIISSFVLRLVTTVLCFYGLIRLFLAIETGIIMLMAMLGFLLARIILTRRLISQVISIK
ncbi:ATP synthase subunit I [Crocosphaera sp. XPORK-15E]|uniref:ATP synthase subunit I n=1 Tax=Crocosphaera sp. XPORK-15E TaxID=3110247 RepID=UPI002B2101FC|nr:ATP synthase subunit I [Crocosphaera sp. XPORK-15E]MEA5534974.1 ATP synthase subunit I [Crocosphaera sp. XPORK-15E]